MRKRGKRQCPVAFPVRICGAAGNSEKIGEAVRRDEMELNCIRQAIVWSIFRPY